MIVDDDVRSWWIFDFASCVVINSDRDCWLLTSNKDVIIAASSFVFATSRSRATGLRK